MGSGHLRPASAAKLCAADLHGCRGGFQFRHAGLQDLLATDPVDVVPTRNG
jgi:hypothetical protein